MGSSSTENPDVWNDIREDKGATNSIANVIIQKMGDCERNREFEDCSVVVEGKIFGAHSFVLLSCSNFIRSRYSTNIEEHREMTFQLNNISASTFELILEILYTGKNLLTENNIKDLWNGVNQLQIDFLMKLCEDFVLAQLTLDNVAMYKREAESLYSQRARLGILYFIMKNFAALCNSEVFLDLNMEDLKHVFESDDLLVESEDIVLQAIYGWVDSNKNERKKFLADVLHCTRYCLASKSCIAILRKHPFSINDSRVIEIFDVALAFNVYFMRGFWPTAAIHRNCVGLEHVGVYCNIDNKIFVHLSLKENKVINFTDIPALRSEKLTIAHGKLFAFTKSRSKFKVFTLEKQLWLPVCMFKLYQAQEAFMSVLAQNKYIFILTKNRMSSFDPDDRETTFQENIHGIAHPQHAISLRKHILLFGSVGNDRVEETTVHSWRSETKTWSHLINLPFTAKGMTSFEDDLNWYILDAKGRFWKLINSDTVVFTFIGKLWDATLKLKAALLFKKTLFLFIEPLELTVSLNFKNDLGIGIFQDVRIHNTTVNMSNVVHLVK